MNSEFYRAFEDRFRGDRELVKSRLEQYLPFIDPLKNVYIDLEAVDLGCGRGEWLELMSEYGAFARGVDLDEGMLSACRERDFNIELGDAVTFLKRLPDESVSIVSGFHIAEHLPFDVLIQLVQESLRVLVPAGLLILETPNPENLIVGAANFYLDPSHEKPIPPQLLAFLPEYSGFERIKTVRLQEPADIVSKKLGLLDVLTGVSPDYAVIAQKTAPEKVLSLFDDTFNREYGVSLTQIATIYGQQADSQEALAEQRSRADTLQGECEMLRFHLEQLAEKNGEQVVALQVSYEQLEAANSQLKEKNRLYEHWSSVASNLDSELLSVYRSRSWTVTWPLRQFGLLVRWLLKLPKRCIRWILVRGMNFVIRRAVLHSWVVSQLRRFPRVNESLRRFARARGVLSSRTVSSQEPRAACKPSLFSSLACRNYIGLVSAIENSLGGRKG